jgi:hypothetical protein
VAGVERLLTPARGNLRREPWIAVRELLVEPRKSAHLDARLAAPERDVGMGGDLVVAVGGPTGTSFATAPSTAISTASWNSISVTRSPACTARAANRKGSMARFGSVGPRVAEMAKCMAGLLELRCW